MSQSRVITASFSSRLHLLLDEKNLTQRQLAEYAGVNEATVSRWLSGSVPSLESVQSVARKTGAPLAWLAFGEGSLEPRPQTIETFARHVREILLPRIDSIIERLNSIIMEPWLSETDFENFEAMQREFGQRRARLVQLVRSMEQLPSDDIPSIEKRLFGEEILDGSSLVDLRTKLCRMLFLDGSSTDDEMLLGMKSFLAEASWSRPPDPRAKAGPSKNRVPSKGAAK